MSQIKCLCKASLSLWCSVVALALGLPASASATTSPSACAAIDDDMARLACFDSFFTNAEHRTSKADLVPDESLAVIRSGDGESFSPILSRRAQEFELADQWFSITPHRPNYLLPATYNASPDYDVYDRLGDAFSDWEVKFQFSLKTLVARNLWRDSSVWVGYTQQSYWQLYAEERASSPFRETNHEPEVYWEIPVDFEVLGWNARLATLAFNHQSNGQIEPFSRSWNRITGELVFDKGPFVASVKSWLRIEEDAEDDDNPDIEDYMGRIQLGLGYKRGDQVFTLGLKNNLSSDNRSGVELNWTFPLKEHIKGFVQVYSGYGENLIDAENYTNRIGVGIALTDWL